MRKRERVRKLVVKRETVRQISTLTQAQLAAVQGGFNPDAANSAKCTWTM